MITRFLLSGVIATAFAFANAHQFDPTSELKPAITRKQVFLALRLALQKTELRDLQFTEAEMSIEQIPATSGNPEIRVTEIDADGTQEILYARARCASRECLPFYVYVRSPDLSAKWGRRTISILRQQDTRVFRQKTKLMMIKAGETATLFVSRPGIRMSMPVQSLQSGSSGDSIRVRAIRTGVLLTGRVEAKGILTSTAGVQ